MRQVYGHYSPGRNRCRYSINPKGPSFQHATMNYRSGKFAPCRSVKKKKGHIQAVRHPMIRERGGPANRTAPLGSRTLFIASTLEAGRPQAPSYLYVAAAVSPLLSAGAPAAFAPVDRAFAVFAASVAAGGAGAAPAVIAPSSAVAASAAPGSAAFPPSGAQHLASGASFLFLSVASAPGLD